MVRSSVEEELLDLFHSQTEGWVNATAVIGNQPGGYKFIIEAVVGGDQGSISIDDIMVSSSENGSCPAERECTFQGSLCGLQPHTSADFSWSRITGTSQPGNSSGPLTDHTLGTEQGYYLSSQLWKHPVGSRGQMVTAVMEPTPPDDECLIFWYYMEGREVGELSVYLQTQDSAVKLWSRSGDQGNHWRHGRVQLHNPKTPYQVIFEAVAGAGLRRDIAIDDLTVLNGACPTPGFCDFEMDFCGWVNSPPAESGVDWDWLSGTSEGSFIPDKDHSTKSSLGHFALFMVFESDREEIAQLESESMPAVEQACLEIWHRTTGWALNQLSSITLTVFVNETSELRPVWNTKGYMNSTWILGKVDYSASGPHQVMFTGFRDTNSQGFIAIDDVTVREGACPSQYVCGFDSGECGFENDLSYVGRWGRKRGIQPYVDHTYRTENGFYMTLMRLNSTQHEEAQLLTPAFTSDTQMCIRFWYWLTKGSSNILAVHVLRSGEHGKALWQRSGAPTRGWEVAEVTVSSPAKFNVVFKAVHIPGSNSAVHLDDFSVRDGACSPSGNCDFESGQCNWVNIPNEGGHNWVLANGGFQGPPTDHTTDTPEGWFFLSSSENQIQSSLAQVASEWIQPKNTTTCLTMWYQMESKSQSGMLRVYIRSGSSEGSLIFQNKSNGPSWTRLSQTMETPKPFQLLIEAETHYRGFIAIDDISLTPGLCQVNETIWGFVGCSFENGTCEWEDISVGQSQWVRGRNATENIGPSVDQTLGTELGWYMAVESDRGDQMSPATLQSPVMKQASSTCTLHFFYNMYGNDVNKLTVLLQESSRTTTLWWESGNHGNVWQHGEVTVGRTHQDFTILFEASRMFSALGHIAIDGVNFTSCTLPDAQPVCPENMFTCNNSLCVERNQVCDFSDDCGDRSDEDKCEQLGVLERCSFEQGLCSWTGSEVDTPGAEWTPHTGQEAWPDLGPPRDHTLNSAAGHYVVPGNHLSVKGQTSEILSRTLLPSTNCTVRFFFYSLDEAAVRLTTQSRKLRSGGGDTVLWIKENSPSYNWRRAAVTYSSSVNWKIVFRYERGESPRELVALDDVSFSAECVFDPSNTELPDTSPTSAPPTSPAPTSPCQKEDEDGCGPCTFESDQCQWLDISEGQRRWQRQKASNDTQPSTDHTSNTGYYMSVNYSQASTNSEARLQSPALPPSSPYCQILFHFHISAECAGSLRVLMQQADGSEAILWSRSHNTVSHWMPEYLPLGLHLQPYKVSAHIWFSSMNEETQGENTAASCVVAVDDISFLSCEESFQPPSPSSYGCSFEDGLCAWMQGAKDDLDWLSRSGPTDTPNTGPAGDHTTGKGNYTYRTITSGKPEVWQKSGNQGDEWLLVQSHVTLQNVHQVILEATVGGEAGDIAIDDISLISGPCPAFDLCDFEEGSCNWQQQTTNDADWVRHSGSTLNPNTGPDSDHTTSTPTGHYYYMPSSAADRAGMTAKMFSPLYLAGEGACVQLWYHMYGRGIGTLNIYQQSKDGKRALIFSQTGDQGRLWRFAQASLLPWNQPHRIVVEGMKTGPTQEGDMAFDDVRLSDAQCAPLGYCDFEGNMCNWSNLGAKVDQGDWLRGRGASLNPNTGPSVDHTTNSSHGYYLYVDNSVGQWGDTTLLVSDVLQPSTGGHCIIFWYHMFGNQVGTLRLFINVRKMQDGGDEGGILKWVESGNRGDKWHEASVSFKQDEAFWFVFVYQRGKHTGGAIALDDISILPGSCYSEPTIEPPDDDYDMLSTGLAVSLTLLGGIIISVFLFIVNKKRCTMNKSTIMSNDTLDQNSVFDLFNCKIDVSKQKNTFYDPKEHK
ncbi:MAM and LDL-receptor class A domain-containing protein 1 [Aulostomus maculatus]